MWVEFCSLKRYVEVLTPGTCECDLVWKKGLCKPEKGEENLQENPNPKWLVSLQDERKVNTDIQGERRVMTETEAGVTQLQAKDAKPRRGRGGVEAEFQRKHAKALISDF